MRRSRAVIAVVVAVLVVVAAYFLGAASEDPVPPPTPSPVPATDDATAGATTGELPETAAASPAAPGEPPPSRGSEPPAAEPAATPVVPPFTGEASTTDPAGDVTDEAGVTAPGEPTAADIVAARVVGDGTELTLTYTLNGQVPVDGESVVWSTEFAVDGGPVALVTVEQAAGSLFTGVFDPTTDEQEVIEDAATLTADQLTVTVPRDALPDVEGPVEWWVLTQRDGGYEDRVPDEGSAGRLPFPG